MSTVRHIYLSATGAALVLAGACVVPIAHAQEQFTVDQDVIGGDVTPPSVPANLSALAASVDQIDLSWDASNDNIGVAGYNIFRDAAFIASTSATTYSDLGLATSTTYAYTVSAFDAAGNESARSATATATTLSGAAPQAPSGGGSPAPGPDTPVISDISVTAGATSAVITWHSDLPTRTRFAWGESREAIDELILQVEYVQEHELALRDLAPGTTYYFTIEAATYAGRVARSRVVSFTTDRLPDAQAPANVTGLSADPHYRERAPSDITLTWQNPREADFEEVRILRSTHFYPTDLYDGELVYEGDGERLVDTEIELDTTYFYTVFARDAAGNYSSGASIHARVVSPTAERPAPDEPHVDAPARPTTPLEDLPMAPSPHPKIESLTLLDFRFIQEGRLLQVRNDRIAIDGTKNLTVELPYERVPEVLKTIGIVLHHPDDPDKTFTFLLRVDEQQTRYRAEIGPLGESGEYEMTIVVVDFKNRGLKKLSGALAASIAALVPGGPSGATPVALSKAVGIVSALSLLAFLLLAFLWRRRKEEEESGCLEGELVHGRVH